MGDYIGATPRNKLLGLLADKVRGVNDLASGNPITNALAGLFGIPAIASTANELSYGGALGTGKGMTWKPKGDTVEAAMALLPMIPPVASGASAGAAFVGRKLEPVAGRMAVSALERGGLPAEMVKAMGQGTKSNVTLVAPHKAFPKQLESVKEEMQRLGPPTIRAYWDGEKYIAIEGSHRAQAAKDLGLTPIIDEVSLKQWIVDHDFPDLKQKSSTNRILDYLEYGTHPGSKYFNFEDL